MSSNGVAKTHQSCPVCKHKKCLTVFTNGTAWCHSHNVDGEELGLDDNEDELEF